MPLLLTLRIALIVLSLITLVLGAAIFLLFPAFLSREIDKATYLGRDANGIYNEVLQKYIAPPYSVQLQVWTFSVQNPNEVINQGQRPQLVEKGPYTFVEKQRKPFVKFTANDSRLLYRNNRTYIFSQEKSCSDCFWTDKICVPNIVFQKFVDIVLNHPSLRFFVDSLLKTKYETAYIKTTVGELLFDGYSDPVISWLCGFLNCKLYDLPDKVGIFYKRNNTDDGVYEIGTGQPDVFNLGKVYSWNGMTSQLNNTYWFGEEARAINGTDAQLFPPDVLLNKGNIKLFIGSLCRSIELEYSQPIDVQGLSAVRYMPAKSMKSVSLQRHMGFCLPNTPKYFNDKNIQEDGCLPSGLLDLGGCAPGAPRIYASSSHFFESSVQLRKAVEGVKEPSILQDCTAVDIEPLTGVVVAAQQRTQLNVGVLRGNLKIVEKMRKATIVPLIWINETAIFDAATRKQLLEVVLIQKLANWAQLICFSVSAILFAGFIGLTVLYKHKYKRSIVYEIFVNAPDQLNHYNLNDGNENEILPTEEIAQPSP